MSFMFVNKIDTKFYFTFVDRLILVLQLQLKEF